ncbi:MAG: phosphonate C-P lyase system protein PhnH [Desulfonatronovibrio sp.]
MDQVFECQEIFRALMRAMSGPGQVIEVSRTSPGGKSLLQAVCETLLDQEVGLAAVGRAVDSSFVREISLSTGCFCTSVKEAGFILVGGGSSEGALAHASRGTLDYPDQGATVIYPVEKLGSGDLRLILKGPGIRDTCKTEITGMDVTELELSAELSSEFPLGLDLIFVDKRSIMAIPRSTEFVSIGSAGQQTKRAEN